MRGEFCALKMQRKTSSPLSELVDAIDPVACSGVFDSYVCKLARGITKQISSTCGQGISAGGARNMMQRLGERIDGEELHAVKQTDADQTEGKKVIPVLFEEISF